MGEGLSGQKIEPKGLAPPAIARHERAGPVGIME
jgi:hypothetical protein